jgi:iron complex outermembrane recepter protein
LNLIEIILAQGSIAKIGLMSPLNKVKISINPRVSSKPTCYNDKKDVMATSSVKQFNNKANKSVVVVFIASTAIIIIANSNSALAQTTPLTSSATTATLKPVIVTGSASDRATSNLASIGDAPLERTPISANVIGAAQIESVGAKRLADLTKFDASVSDAYNTAGYWDYATVRGFVLNNKFNYRREGLPISAETFIALDNKESVDILKGASGIQAGTSAPGGLINYTVKRPTNTDVRTIKLEASSYGSLLGAVDLGGRAGANKEFGYRINAAAEKVDNYTPAAKGNRQLLAVATDWRINKDSILEAEFEYSKRSQPSVPGMSLMGNTLPTPNAKLNINNQPWSQPVVLEGLTGTIKFEQAINNQWRWSAQAGTQNLTSQDRVAFPFGCTDGKAYYASTYCPNGDFDLYDFRSDNETRKTTSAKLEIKGQMDTLFAKINPTFGILVNKVQDRFEKQAYNFSGTGNLNNLAALPADGSLTAENTNRDERSTELYFNNSHNWTADFTTWTGARYTRLNRSSARTDGSRATDYEQDLTTRFVAASYQINPAHMAYASFGQGVESEVAPGRSRYTNAGEALPALTSRQFEIGVKGALEQVRWSAAYFNITRPMFGDLGSCGKTATCTRQVDGTAKHSGLELTASTPAASVAQPWHLDGGVTIINAKRDGSTIDATQNGLRPTNVPDWVLRLNAAYKIAAVPGLQLNGHLSHEGKRAALPDNSINIPAWTRLDLGASYVTKIGNTQATWAFGIDNVMNKSYFKESPYQFGHVYLFPGAPRTARLSVQIAL